MKSLTEGLDLSDKKKAKEESSTDSGKMGQIVVIVVCLVGAALGISWNFGLFESRAPKHNGKAVDPAGTELNEQQKKQVENRQKLLDLPEGSPSRPVTGAN